MKALVTYFSASGVTAKLARRLSDAINAPLYEIKPAVPYTEADLDWRNEQSRSTIEMQDKNCRPALADTNAPVAGADIIFVGYPVWWYREPSIIDSFLEAYDFTGKTIIPFATSGGSPIGDAKAYLGVSAPGAVFKEGRRIGGIKELDALKIWMEGMV